MMSNTPTDYIKMNNNSNKSNTENDIFDIKNDQYIETPWHIIESYFNGHIWIG